MVSRSSRLGTVCNCVGIFEHRVAEIEHIALRHVCRKSVA